MRNASHGASLPPLPFDDLAGLHVIVPRNKLEEDAATHEYERALAPAATDNQVYLIEQALMLVQRDLGLQHRQGQLTAGDAEALLKMTRDCALFLISGQ